jgi:hypothetical protein
MQLYSFLSPPLSVGSAIHWQHCSSTMPPPILRTNNFYKHILKKNSIVEKNKQNIYTLLQALARPNFPTTAVLGSSLEYNSRRSWYSVTCAAYLTGKI